MGAIQEASGDELATRETPEGLEDVTQDDLVFPRRRIVQPISQVGTPGMFRCSLTGEEAEELVVTPLRYRPGRVLWDPRDVEMERPICRSRDGLVPDSSIEEPAGQECCRVEGNRRVPVCMQAQWGENGERPPCAQTREFIMLDHATRMPFLMSLSRSATKAAKSILSYASLRRVPLYYVQAALRLNEVRSSKGKYFVPEVHSFAVIDSDEPRALYNTVQGYDDARTDQAEQSSPSASDDGMPF